MGQATLTRILNDIQTLDSDELIQLEQEVQERLYAPSKALLLGLIREYQQLALKALTTPLTEEEASRLKELMGQTAIQATGLSKQYHIGRTKVRLTTLQERLMQAVVELTGLDLSADRKPLPDQGTDPLLLNDTIVANCFLGLRLLASANPRQSGPYLDLCAPSVNRARSIGVAEYPLRRRDDAGDALRSGPYHAGALDEMVLAQGLGHEDRQAPRDEEGDRGAGASVGRDHAPHLG
jgi:hypothetical protein